MISKEERERAEGLDCFLRQRISEIAEEVGDLGLAEKSTLQKWHTVGQRLMFVDDPTLVSAQDRDTGAVWLAIRQYCPHALLPKGEQPLTPQMLAMKLSGLESERRLGKKHDHFERCYKLGKLDITEIDWLTWSDFDAFLESPGLERDPRILSLLARHVRNLGRRLSRREFRAVCKKLRESIPTKQRQRDTSQLSERELTALVNDAFSASGLR